MLLSIFLPSVLSQIVDKSAYPPPYTLAPPNPSFTINNQAEPSPDIESCTSGSFWALAYDDGPSPTTPKILDYLRSKSLIITFFLVGSQILDNQETVKQAFKDGHELGVHTWSHPSLPSLSDDQIIAEIEWTAKLITEITGKRPVYFRPPYGDTDDRVRKIVAGLGLTSILWSYDTKDYTVIQNLGQSDIDRIVGEIGDVGSKSDGVISLSHDLFPAASNLAVDIVEAIEKTGKKIVPMGKCVGADGSSGTALRLAAGPVSGDESTRLLSAWVFAIMVILGVCFA